MNLKMICTKPDGNEWCVMQGRDVVAWITADSECEAWRDLAEQLLTALRDCRRSVVEIVTHFGEESA